MKQLFWETVNPLLKEILQDLITESNLCLLDWLEEQH